MGPTLKPRDIYNLTSCINFTCKRVQNSVYPESPPPVKLCSHKNNEMRISLNYATAFGALTYTHQFSDHPLCVWFYSLHVCFRPEYVTVTDAPICYHSSLRDVLDVIVQPQNPDIMKPMHNLHAVPVPYSLRNSHCVHRIRYAVIPWCCMVYVRLKAYSLKLNTASPFMRRVLLEEDSKRPALRQITNDVHRNYYIRK